MLDGARVQTRTAARNLEVVAAFEGLDLLLGKA
jgi:hypothetical protein